MMPPDQQTTMTPAAPADQPQLHDESDRLVAALTARVQTLENTIARMRTNVAGRQMLDRGAEVSQLDTAARTDTAGVRKGTHHYYSTGSAVVEQVFDGTAWQTTGGGGGGAAVGNGTYTLTNPLVGTNGVAADAARTDMRLTVPAPVTPSTSAVGDAAAQGATNDFAKGGHVHAREAFATPTVGVSSTAAAGSAATVMRSDATFKIPLVIGGVIPITGGRFVRVQGQNLSTGNNDLYTCPANTRAWVVSQWGIYNGGGIGAITSTAYVQFLGAGTRYPMANPNAALAMGAASFIAGSGLILEPTDKIGVTVATSNGLNVALAVVEFPNTIPVHSSIVKDPASGDNTVYTCPASTNATVLSATSFAPSTSGQIVFINGSGGALNISFNVVPSGGSVSSANQFAPATAVNGTTVFRNTNFSNTGVLSLNAGDVISANWSGTNTGGLTWVTVAEIAGA